VDSYLRERKTRITLTNKASVKCRNRCNWLKMGTQLIERYTVGDIYQTTKASGLSKLRDETDKLWISMEVTVAKDGDKPQGNRSQRADIVVKMQEPPGWSDIFEE
jgi:hypothetical protein